MAKSELEQMTAFGDLIEKVSVLECVVADLKNEIYDDVGMGMLRKIERLRKDQQELFGRVSTLEGLQKPLPNSIRKFLAERSLKDE